MPVTNDGLAPLQRMLGKIITTRVVHSANKEFVIHAELRGVQNVELNIEFREQT
ncbi:4515_t:CDS:2 [Entrophospora sp. SA101]|nr:5268_t:CDS:2 [Entrophospora sp. SA101]CAJ0632893.1 4515_t:CDS:2 [Entrophospora sp. SA101]CAJ0840462.1 554_t:CDS:2 [Entrophospora sp. SA101]CAJ0900907.1 5097_t:CDS:2 [Entrophospora sp. SA101]